MNLSQRINNKLNNANFNIYPPFPKKNLLIEITNHCNNKCIFCYNQFAKRKRQFIDENLCKKVLIEAYNLGMREVGFYVTGEPLLNKKLEEYIMYAKKLGYEYIYITTNGILASLERVKKLYTSGLDSIKFSINASNANDYKLIHGIDCFDKVIKNLKDIYRWKNKNNIKMNVYVSYISTDLTLNDLEIGNIFKNSCDELIIMPAINQGGLLPSINKISSRDENRINKLNIPCNYIFNSVIVTVEGYLSACCMDFENLLAYADLNKYSLEESWTNETITKLRKKHTKKNVNGTICKNCIYNSLDTPFPIDKNLCDTCIDKSILDNDIEKLLIKRRKNGSN